MTGRSGPGCTGSRATWQRIGLRLAGAGLLAVTGAIHLDLYLTGYRSIPVIGPLFLLQVIAAFGLAAAVLVSGSRLAALAGAGFVLSVLGGYLLSVSIGLFGFKEIRTTAGIVAGLIEVAAFAALAMLALSPAAARQPAGPVASRSGVLARLQAGVPGARTATAAVSVAALVLLGAALAGAGGPGASVAGVQRHVRTTPEVPSDFGRHLEDDELVGPGREPALSPEVPELRGDGHQRIRRRLVGQVLEFRAGDPQPRAAPPGLSLRDAQQHSVQPGQRRLALLAVVTEHLEPLG